VGGKGHALAALSPVPIVKEAGWAPGPVWTGAENLASTEFRFPDCPACSESLYRLNYPGPQGNVYEQEHLSQFKNVKYYYLTQDVVEPEFYI